MATAGARASRARKTESLPAPRFDLRLLGGFELITAAGTAVELPTRKCELLLAYLAMPAGRSHGRDKLAALFWSDRDDEQARGSLRKALSALRAALGPDALTGERDAIALDPAAVTVDADHLAALAGDSNETNGDAVALRYGEFLESRPSASAEFADWLTFERTRCRNLAQTVLEKSATRLAATGNLSEALTVGQRLLAIDTLREESHRLLMRLYASAGERSRALTQFRDCRDLLKRELGVEPSQETVRLSREIASDAEAGTPAVIANDSAATPNWPTERSPAPASRTSLRAASARTSSPSSRVRRTSSSSRANPPPATAAVRARPRWPRASSTCAMCSRAASGARAHNSASRCN
jgi:DNA-binding SARP family transcriptional activator